MNWKTEQQWRIKLQLCAGPAGESVQTGFFMTALIWQPYLLYNRTPPPGGGGQRRWNPAGRDRPAGIEQLLQHFFLQPSQNKRQGKVTVLFALTNTRPNPTRPGPARPSAAATDPPLKTNLKVEEWERRRRPKHTGDVQVQAYFCLLTHHWETWKPAEIQK